MTEVLSLYTGSVFILLTSIFILICTCLCIFTLIWCNNKTDGRDDMEGNSLPCVEHELVECIDCMKVYGFYAEGVKLIDPCDDHERALVQYETDLKDCLKCNIIDRRYGF